MALAIAAPYAALTREDFDRVIEFVATGGYALKAYDRFRRIVRARDENWPSLRTNATITRPHADCCSHANALTKH